MIDVRLLRQDDIDGLTDLLEEMQAHYRVPCPPREAIAGELRRIPAGVTIIVATDPAVVGFAALCSLFPGPGLRPGLFLKELFVAARGRKQGIGKALLCEAASFAVANGFHRLDWTADAKDAALIRFYEQAGAVSHPDKMFFRLTGGGFEALAQRQ